MSPSREEQKAETRARIQAAARDGFEAEGYEVSMRSIAKRAGVAVGTLFVHFPDKAALLADVFGGDLEAVLERAWGELPRSPLGEQLLHLAGALYAYYAQRPALSRVLVKESLFLSGESGHAMTAQAVRFVEAVQDLFAQAGAAGQLPDHLDPARGGSLFFSLYFSTLVGGLRGEAGEGGAAWTRELRANLEPALGPGAFANTGGGAAS